MYDASIARFNSIDRFSEKYNSHSSYQYALNDPISNIEVNGDSVWKSYKAINDSQGNRIGIRTTIHITGKVLVEGNIGKAREIAQNLTDRLNAQKKGKTRNFDDGSSSRSVIEIKASFTGTSDIGSVKTQDHLVNIVDDVTGTADPKLGGGPAAGKAEVGGQIAHVEQSGMNNEQIAEVAFHEVGHNLGLEHPDANNISDPMSYTGKGSNFSYDQLQTIVSGAQNKGVNRVKMSTAFPNIRENENARSTEKRPFNRAPSQTKLIPRPFNN